jgi:hypothetical protein
MDDVQRCATGARREDRIKAARSGEHFNATRTRATLSDFELFRIEV